MNFTYGPEGETYFNDSFGSPEYQNLGSSNLYVFSKYLRNIYIPLVSIIGLVGNTMSILVFTSQKMKKSSSSVFLAALAVVDNIFLVSLLITWFDGEWHQIIRNALTCQLIIYTTYVSSFLSVWLVVCFTYERFFAISFPLKINFLCTVYREKVVVIGLLILACILYNFCFWTITTREVADTVTCTHKFEYFDFLTIVTWLDTTLTMVVPFFAILYGNIKVVFHVVRCSAMSCKQSQNPVSSSTFETSAGARSVTERPMIFQPRKNRSIPQLRVTRTLLLVSTTFLILNLPSHIVRLYSIILTISSTPETYMISSPMLLFVQEVTYLLYYTTFSCNFVLYTIFGRNFQSVLRNLLSCKSHKQDQREIMLGKLSSGH